MDFSTWLSEKLKRNGLSRGELTQNAHKHGYKISRGQITHILNGTRQAGPEACIAIAAGLGVSREEVFRARGWLLQEPEQVIPPQATPDVAKLIRDLTSLDDDTQKRVTQNLQYNLETILHFVKEQRAPYGEES